MLLNRITSKGRNIERVFLLLIAIVMGILFFQLSRELNKDFAEVPRRISDGTMINLNFDQPGERMRALLIKGFYFEDKKDINLIAAAVDKGRASLTEPIDNIGELNKRRYNINAEEAYAVGGKSYRRRIEISRALLGFSEMDSIFYEKELKQPLQVSAGTAVNLGDHKISGTVQVPSTLPVPGVLIRLHMIVPKDSIFNSEEVAESGNLVKFENGVRRVMVPDSANQLRLQSFSAYARTDANGKFSFSGLPSHTAFEILPLQPGFQFGRSQGVSQLEEDVDFTFTQSPHTLKLFSTQDFNTFKKEKAFIVRMPGEVVKWFWIIFAVFLAGFLLLHIILNIRFPQADQFILPIIMVLVGLSFLTLLSLQDPLRDRFLAKNSVIYFSAGIVGIIILMLFDLRKFTTDSWLFRLIVFRKVPGAANGWPWAIAAIGLLILTIIFGTGPEGSGVKVNLLGLQPSEIVKFLVIIFLAGFFAMNEKFISEYSTWRKRFSFSFVALFAIVTTILLFLLLGDLGPAVVCCFTFIILFSFSRGDFMPMAASVVLYVLSIWISGSILIGTAVTIGMLLLYMFIRKKRLSESAIMALVIVSGFLLLDQVPVLDSMFPGPVKRLVDRK
ncbi:MAG: FtsW/RodA/SpoVE family cell cycle protein, partial [Chitinophagaceae bacterium]